MKKLPFSIQKIGGAGNTFLFIDARKGGAFWNWETQKRISRTELTQRFCQRQIGAADGLIFLDEAGSDWVWDFYNADGSGAEMCGNAARCVGLYLSEELSRSAPFSLKTAAGAVSVSADPQGQWAVEMPELSDGPRAFTVQIGEGSYSGYFVNSGVPHFVIPLSGEALLSREVCGALRFHPEFGPAGTNVTLLRGHRAQTFERGVEDFTAACGTGAVAAATVLVLGTVGSATVKIEMPGGDLEVFLGGRRPILKGPTTGLVYMEINEEIFQ